MNTFVTLAAVSATALALAACETTAQRIGSKEDTLAAAGFTVLPANKFVPKTTGDTTQYVYADPVVCGCLYIGDQKAYGAYRQDVLTKKIVDEQQMTAMTYQDNWNWGGFDWGPWGHGWWR